MTSQGDQAATDFKAQISEQIKRAMKRRKISQSELARQMRTSRAVVHRMLCPTETAITLTTISKAAVALELTPRIKLVA